MHCSASFKLLSVKDKVERGNMTQEETDPAGNVHNAIEPTDAQQALPQGWEELVDVEGRTYYVDHNSRTTTYERPSMSDVQASLAPGWQEVVDDDEQIYYAHHGSGTTTFQRPSWPRLSAATAALPAGWELRRNRHGVAYFIDHNTRTTTWDDPRSADA